MSHRAEEAENEMGSMMMTPRSEGSFSSDSFSDVEDEEDRYIIDWSMAEGLPDPPPYVERVVRESIIKFVFDDTPFHGTKLPTRMLTHIPFTEEMAQFFRETQTVDVRQHTSGRAEFQLVFTRPDARQAEENTALKDRCWINFTHGGNRWDMEMYLGLLPDPSHPYAEGVEILFTVRKRQPLTGVFDVDLDYKLHIGDEEQWGRFVTMVVEPKLAECRALDATDEMHSEHTTDAEEEEV